MGAKLPTFKNKIRLVKLRTGKIIMTFTLRSTIIHALSTTTATLLACYLLYSFGETALVWIRYSCVNIVSRRLKICSRFVFCAAISRASSAVYYTSNKNSKIIISHADKRKISRCFSGVAPLLLVCDLFSLCL